MDKNVYNILKEKLILINLEKREFYRKILKSISQNNNVKGGIRVYANYVLIKKDKKSCFLSRKHKICLFTGRRGGLFKHSNFSRIKFKNLILNNKYTNFKKNNW